MAKQLNKTLMLKSYKEQKSKLKWASNGCLLSEAYNTAYTTEAKLKI